jgi:3-oxoacyl-[acyl-carrier-protein] synthase II
MARHDIVITGAGIVSSIGIGVDAVAASLSAKRSGIGAMRYLSARHNELPVGEVKMSNDEMKSQLGISRDDTVSRTTLMGILAVKQALDAAGISGGTPKRIILISGTTVAGMDITEQRFSKMMTSGVKDVCLDHHTCGSCTADIAGYFHVFSDFTTISTACSSALNALILGADMLKAGDADMVVAGGSEALSQFHLDGFNALMILDKARCRPFDKDRQGLNLGEGAAYLVLEREEAAVARKAHIEAYLSGYGNACDAYHQTASSPEDIGAQIAMREALEMSGLKPHDVQWVHAHGTGTPDNDSSESAAIKKVFGDSIPVVSSTKAFTGHTTSASGGISAVISLIALHQNFVPDSLGFAQPMDNGLKPAMDNIPCTLHHVMVNSFGFGGNDSSMILSKESCAGRQEHFISDEQVIEAARVENTDPGLLKDIKLFVKPMEARRMGKLMKNTLLTSLKALQQSGIDMPDAIVTGTKWGSLECSEQLLIQLAQVDDMFKPTFFMQSTHNTCGSLIAIHLKCHGYNVTFSQDDRSMEWALYQARLLLRSGRCKTVLVGCHDESTPLFDKLRESAGESPQPSVGSVAVVLKLKE